MTTNAKLYLIRGKSGENESGMPVEKHVAALNASDAMDAANLRTFHSLEHVGFVSMHESLTGLTG